MIHKVLYLTTLCLILGMPALALAMEQSFTQNDLKATVKLSPDELTAESKVNLALKLEKDGQPVTDRKVTLEVYEKDKAEPVLKREVDVLEDEYIDSWSFEKTGDYKVVATVADPQQHAEAIRYEVNATVGEAKPSGHEGHGFFSHHFGGGKWGWWGGGLMLLMMIPMMLIAL
ncbi:hypothetical protein [Geobacter sp. DSM 9736]|uniref:hypothetical protein n=1 Tax=Geobacter sp. DSM 9736 TaxID=1277350 RepID=UPI000B616EA2|nr:hypothetical protein [Geobacter sp. DSM 9736]SNB45374.1 hypothetical protein SAMN06269301_0787 [Geobacter sp. DSM 9736]